MIKNITLGSPSNISKALILSILASVSNLIPFIALAKIVEYLFLNRASGAVDSSLLWRYFGIMAVFLIATWVLEDLAAKYTYELGYKQAADGRVKLADHIRKLPLGSLADKSSSEIFDTLMHDFFKIETAITHELPQFFSGLCVAILCSILFLLIDLRMGIAMLVGLPLSVLLLRLMQNFQKRIYLKAKEINIKEAEGINEYISTIKTLKAYSSVKDSFNQLTGDIENVKKANIEHEKGVGSLITLSGMILRIGLPLMSLVGSYLFLTGDLAIDTFLMFLFVGTRVFDPLELALANYAGLQEASVSGERILNLLNTEPMPGQEGLGFHNDIEIDRLSFSYRDSRVLEDITVRINENELTAFVGPSGSGKSTLVKLISRFYDPDQGTIKVGGIPLAEADPSKVMEKFSVVFQEAYLFKDTIYNNIKFGREEASEEEVIRAAKMAGAYDFIVQKEKGFETMVGQGGATLSGGEKQRISIARAILKDAPIILLDEATSSLDPENERIVQQAISNLIKNKTVIVVAHKLRSVMGADKIVVLNQGRVVEIGRHDSLIDKNGLYKELWAYQEKSKAWQIVP